MPGIPLLDELMANAWRPRLEETQSGWRFRWSDGVTRRANSTLAVGANPEVRALVDRAEGFYLQRAAPSVILVSTASAPQDLEACLEDRHYRTSARTLVEQAATLDVVNRTQKSIDIDIEITETPSDEWFDAYWDVEAGRGRHDRDAAVYRDVLLSPGLPTLFAAARHGPDVIGVGQMVTERGWAGVQCMATRPAYRRKGIAGAVLNGLAKEARDRGTDRMYLAVMVENGAASGLYRRSGFTGAHEYCYYSNANVA